MSINYEEHIVFIYTSLEDQQRINSFSKLNTRLRGIEEKLEELKVGSAFGIVVYIENPLNSIQQEKEALDDLSTELELAYEDEPVL